MNGVPVIAVDGPGGAGKGTLCHRLASRLGWHLLDSGALYRLVALAAERSACAVDDEAGLAAIAEDLDAEFVVNDDPEHPTTVLLDGVAADAELRTERCAAGASRVAALPAVRTALLARQRAFRAPPGLVADGRDMGTVVFPDATAKLYIDASPSARAGRRHKQLMKKGIAANLNNLLADIRERDARDCGRVASPLRAADDAVRIDTTGLSIDDVFERALEVLAGRGLAL